MDCSFKYVLFVGPIAIPFSAFGSSDTSIYKVLYNHFVFEIALACYRCNKWHLLFHFHN